MNCTFTLQTQLVNVDAKCLGADCSIHGLVTQLQYMITLKKNVVGEFDNLAHGLSELWPPLGRKTARTPT